MKERRYYRSCNPDWWSIDEDRPTSQLFLPTPKDNGKLSVVGSRWTTPEKFYAEYVGVMGLSSLGIWELTASECKDIPTSKNEQPPLVTLKVTQDFGPGKPTGHCLIHMENLSSTKQRRVAKALRNRAANHGRLFP